MHRQSHPPAMKHNSFVMTQTSNSTPNFFTAGSPFLKHPLLTTVRTNQEVDFIVEACGLSGGSRILDVGCGVGRHSIELARRGYNVTGIDPSAAMIAAARRRADRSGVFVDFQQERGELFATDQPYDAAICLFTTLGQITENGHNLDLVGKVYAALKAGAYFLVEVPQRETAVSQLKTEEKISGANRVVYVTRRYDENNLFLTEEFRIVDEREESSYLLKYRLFDQAELTVLLNEAGFKVLAAYGDYQGSNLSGEDSMMLLLTEKG